MSMKKQTRENQLERQLLKQQLTATRTRLRETVEEYVSLDEQLRALDSRHFRVCIFGSARIPATDPRYRDVADLAGRLAMSGIDIVTGGGPGLMEAANKGASEARRARSRSFGLPLDLPSLVEPANPHLHFRSAHKRFSSRLDEFIRLSHGVVVAPGGIGTILELAYVWQLLQLDAMEPRPVILWGREFWRGLLDWVRAVPVAGGLADEGDLQRLQIADSVDEVTELLLPAHRAFLAGREEPARDAGSITLPFEPPVAPGRLTAA